MRALLNNFGFELSRNNISLTVVNQPEETSAEACCSTVALQAQPKEIAAKLKLSNIKIQQSQDRDLQVIINKFKNTKYEANEGYVMTDGLLYKLDVLEKNRETAKLCIPKSLITNVLTLFHDDNYHLGIRKVMLDIKSQLTWGNMQKDVTKYINQCGTCIKAKMSNNNKVKEGHLRLPARANNTVAIDILGSLPKCG